MTNAYTTPLNFNLIFLDDVLSENRVNRRWSGEECKRGKGLGRSRRNKRLDDPSDRRDVVQRDGCLGQLHAYVCGGAERAVRVGDISLRMDMNNLNRPAGNNQRDAQQGEKKSPRGSHLRF